MGETQSQFERLLAAANDVLNDWFDRGSPHDPGMIELHCAARALDRAQHNKERD